MVAANVQGERQTPMDVFADTLLNDALRPLAKALASEEADAVIAGAIKLSRRVSTPSTRRRAVDSLVDWHTGLAGSGETYEKRARPAGRVVERAVSLPTGTIFGVQGGRPPRNRGRTS